MALWRPTGYEKKTVISGFAGGINREISPFEINEGETLDCLNMSSSELPGLTAVKSRLLLETMSTGSTSVATSPLLFARDEEELHVVNGNTWSRYTGDLNTTSPTKVAVTTALTGTSGFASEFATGTQLYSLLVNSVERLAWDGTTSAPVSMTTNCPYGPVTTHKGRIYVGNGKRISYSALQKTTDWTTASDAGSITVTNSRGDITAITEFAGNVVVFTKRTMHILYGTGPSNYSLTDISNEVGCIAHQTLKELDGKLYWLSENGVYCYAGGLPVRISDKIKFWINQLNQSLVGISSGSSLYSKGGKCCADVRNGRYIISFPTINDPSIFEYYPVTGQWLRFSGRTTAMVNISDNQTTFGGLITADSVTGGLFNRNPQDEGADTNTSWQIVTKFFNDASIEAQKTLTDLAIVYDLGNSTSVINMYYTTSVNDAYYSTAIIVGSLIAGSSLFTVTDGPGTLRVKTGLNQLQNVDHYALKIIGKGSASIFQIQRNLKIKKLTD